MALLCLLSFVCPELSVREYWLLRNQPFLEGVQAGHLKLDVV